MKIRFVTLGCKLNFAESSALGKVLLSRGHQRASLSEVPDLCVVNTCSVTDAADHKDRQAINQLHRKYPNAIIVVTGCYAQLQPEQISHIEGVDYVLGQNEKYDIPALVDTLESRLPIPDSRFRTLDSRLPTPIFGLPTPDSRPVIHEFHFSRIRQHFLAHFFYFLPRVVTVFIAHDQPHPFEQIGRMYPMSSRVTGCHLVFEVRTHTIYRRLPIHLLRENYRNFLQR